MPDNAHSLPSIQDNFADSNTSSSQSTVHRGNVKHVQWTKPFIVNANKLQSTSAESSENSRQVGEAIAINDSNNSVNVSNLLAAVCEDPGGVESDIIVGTTSATKSMTQASTACTADSSSPDATTTAAELHSDDEVNSENKANEDLEGITLAKINVPPTNSLFSNLLNNTVGKFVQEIEASRKRDAEAIAAQKIKDEQRNKMLFRKYFGKNLQDMPQIDLVWSVDGLHERIIGKIPSVDSPDHVIVKVEVRTVALSNCFSPT